MRIVTLVRAAHGGPQDTTPLPWLTPADRAALSTSLALAGPDDSVVCMTAAPETDESYLTLALQAGAPRAVRVWDPTQAADELQRTCALLATGVQRAGFDLVVTGDRSADWGSGSVGPALSQLLGVPHLTSVIAVAREGDLLVVDHLGEQEVVTVELRTPVLLAVRSGPPLPSREAQPAGPVESWDLQDPYRTLILDLEPPNRIITPRDVAGPAMLSSAAALAEELKSAGLKR